MKNIKKLLGLLLVLLLSFSMQISAESKKGNRTYEGTVLEVSVAYGGAEKSFAQFTEETGIQIEWISMSTGAKLSQLQAEKGKTTTDVWFGGGVDSYINAAKLGYLHKYRSPECVNIDDAYLDPNGHWAALAIVPHGIIVNVALLNELGIDMPKTWRDLIKPQYRGEIILADPSISGGQYAIHSGLIQAMGEDYAWKLWETIDKNVAYYAQSGGEPQQKVVAGEFAIGLTAIHGQTFALMETAPVKAIFVGEVPWIPAPIAIFENSKKKEAAKVLVDWYLSEHGQNVLMKADARIMANKKILMPTQLMEILDTDKLINFDLEKMGTDRDKILKRWKTITDK